MLDHWIGGSGKQYSDFVWRAVTNSDVFRQFRAESIYTKMVEILTPAQGEACYERITNALIRELCLESEQADTIGTPKTMSIQGKRLSPTTLRYAKVLDELVKLFPTLPSWTSVCEIGVGYGGQARMVCEYFKRTTGLLSAYTLVDLTEALLLARRYLEHFWLPNEFQFRSKTELAAGKTSWNLVISNYAFSEFNRALQAEYLEKVLVRARCGYLAMNTGLRSPRSSAGECFTLDELLKILPNATALKEEPLTGANNYILVFGDHVVRAEHRS